MGFSNEDIVYIETKTQECYLKEFGQVFRNFELEIPESYRDFLLHKFPDNRQGKRDFIWYDTAESIVDNTKFFMGMNSDHTEGMLGGMVGRNRGKGKKGMWLAIAEWADRHMVWICCQKGHKKFGHVVDTFDGDPWDYNSGTYTFNDFADCYAWWEKEFKLN